MKFKIFGWAVTIKKELIVSYSEAKRVDGIYFNRSIAKKALKITFKNLAIQYGNELPHNYKALLIIQMRHEYYNLSQKVPGLKTAKDYVEDYLNKRTKNSV